MAEGNEKCSKYVYTQNRELSWLRFDRRVLEEAGDINVPLFERLKFISIFCTNLDEFFMVRAGSLHDLAKVAPDEIDNKSGLTPKQQLEAITGQIPELILLKKKIYSSVMSSLGEEGIHDLSYEELHSFEQKFINSYFNSNIFPVVSPIIVSTHHPVPHLVNKCIHISVLLKDKKGKTAIGMIPLPDSLPSYVKLPQTDLRFIRMENIILHWVDSLFGSYKAVESCLICVTRNGDLSLDEDKFEDDEDDYRLSMAKLLKKRDHQSVVRLEINGRISDIFFDKLIELIHVKKELVVFDECPLNMHYVMQLEKELSSERRSTLLYPKYYPRWPEDLTKAESIIEQVQQKDRLLFYPFDSVEPFLSLLSEASERKDVISIKITIYRLASSSKIARILCNAAENGKNVIVLMELRARFDEANNIAFSKMLEEAGCQVVYGVPGYKCHSKICLITIRTGTKMQYITQIGTGNYNEKTNQMYTDLSLMTASDKIGLDGTSFFHNMLINHLDAEYQEIRVSPAGIKTELSALIAEQTEKKENGYICIKANALTERSLIDQLQKASNTGVQIQLIIRGICCLLPQVNDHTEHIEVTSIVGRYLEHGRIYCFGRGSEAKYYISSADLMTRNLNRRIEIACPVHDEDLKHQIQQILDIQLKDNKKASFLDSHGNYIRKEDPSMETMNSQEYFMAKSMHHPAEIPVLQQDHIFHFHHFIHLPFLSEAKERG